MSKAEKRACQYTGYCRNQSYSDFLNGYHKAEKDLALTWKDIVMIDKLLIDLGMIFPAKSTPDYYQEVLKRFKDYKERR